VAGPFVQVSAGGFFTCALRPNGDALCWGSDSTGVPGAVTGPFVQLSAGGGHVCALEPDGDATCWGWNDAGQAPASVAGPFTQIGAGEGHTCAVALGGNVRCWGTNGYGQAPASVAGPFVQVAAGSEHTCAVTATGTWSCWGHNNFQQVGPNDPPPAPTLLTPPDGSATADATPTLDWDDTVDPDGDAVTYRLQVDDAANFSSPVISTTSLIPTSGYTPGADLPEGTYHWRVWAFDGNVVGPWSAVWTFTVGTNQPPPAPTLLAPTDATATNDATPALDWAGVVDPDGDAVTYEVQGDLHADFSSPELEQTGLSQHDFTPAAPIADGTYEWRVRANDGTADGPWSTVRTVTVHTGGPDIQIAAPTGTHARFEVVTVHYGCTDPMEVALCQGPVDDLGRADTSTVGRFTFTVQAEDALGNPATEATTYRVRNACMMQPTITPGPGQTTIVGTAGDDVIRAVQPGVAYTIDAGDGDDVVCAGAGADVVTTGNGNDVVVSGGGADTVYPGAGHDYVDGGPGVDEVRGGPGDDRLVGRTGPDTLSGGAGADLLKAGAGADSLDSVDGVVGNDDVDGGSGADRCTVDEDAQGTTDPYTGCETVIRSRI
jgi:Ca2+-binding RTX toxin-like protein